MSELTNERLQADFALFLAGKIVGGKHVTEDQPSKELIITRDTAHNTVDYSAVEASNFAYVSLGNVREAYKQGRADQAAIEQARAINRISAQKADTWDVEQDQLHAQDSKLQPTDNVA